jgi:hypothetical protein
VLKFLCLGLCLALAACAPDPDTAVTTGYHPDLPQTPADAAVDSGRADVRQAEISWDDAAVDADVPQDASDVSVDAGEDVSPDASEDVTDAADVSDSDDVSADTSVPDAASDCGSSRLWTRSVNFHDGDPLPADTDEYELTFRGPGRLYPIFSAIYMVVYEEYMGAWHMRSLTVDMDRDIRLFTDEEGSWLECEYAAGRTATFRYRFRVRRGDVAGVAFFFNAHEAGSASLVAERYSICDAEHITWPVEIRQVGSATVLRITPFTEPRHYPGAPCYGLIEGSPCPPDATRQPDGSCRL